MNDYEFELEMRKTAAKARAVRVVHAATRAAPNPAAAVAAAVAPEKNLWDFAGMASRGLGSAFSSAGSEAGKQLVAKMFRPTLSQQLLDPRSGMIPKALVLGTGAAGIAAGAQALDRYLDERKRTPEALQRNIASMVTRFPEVSELDPKDIEDSMRTLQTFNPIAASDPLTAASYVKRYSMYRDEGIHPSDLKTLAEAGRNVIDQNKQELSKSPSALVRSFQNALSFAE